MNDNMSKREEFEIRLDELFWSVLRHWRGIVIAMVIVGILFAGFGAAREYKNYRDPVAREEAEKAYELAVEQYDNSIKSAETKIENLKKWIERQDVYKESSLLLLMDPYDIYKATVIYYIDSAYEILPEMSYQNPNYTRTLVNSYASAINRLPFDDIIDLPGEQDLTTEYIVSGYNKKICSVSSDADNGLLTITIICDTDDRGEVLLKAIKNEMTDYETFLNKVVGEHNISIVGENIEHTIDMDIVNLQSKYTTDYDYNVSELEKTEKQLEEMTEPEKTVHSKTTIIKQGVKYGVLGLLLGLIASAFILAVSVFSRRRVISVDSIQRQLGIPVLGVISTSGKKLNRFDKWIASRLGLNGLNDPEALVAYAVSTVRLKTEPGSTLQIIGTADESKIREAADLLIEKNSDRMIRMVGDISRNADAVNGLEKGIPTVCVEQWPCSGYEEIEREQELLRVSENKCIGVVVVI